ncbi:transcription initiation factor TFIID subunit 11-like [Papaver somniferum]|uniref:transcription initiation factor TFIID subunit 11-like n=1 Tax=Papaver somniferum TaxID=3469 RepID=UPI000E6FD2A9|nr:transcription initiation factor TFIID subunit 11-like [Papaver somniferum]
MAASRSSNYDSDYSSSFSEEDSKISVDKARANADHAKEIINKMSLDELKAARDEILKRKERHEIINDYREKRRINQQKILKSEEKLRSRPDGVASNSDASDAEEEFVWDLTERKSRSYPPHRESERLVKDDFQDEYDEEDYWDAINGDIVEEEEFPSSDSDSEKESDEGSTEDDDDDDESDG